MSSAKQPGDKPAFGGSPQDKLVLIHDIIELIQQKGPNTLHILTKDLSEYLHAQEKLSPSNLYRKQYGNLNHVFNTEDFSQIFHIEKDVIKLRPLKDLSSAVSASHLQPNEYSKCQGMWRGKFAHDIKTLRTTQSNQCARCGDIYRESVASMPLCGSQPHAPLFDFGKSDDDLVQLALQQ